MPVDKDLESVQQARDLVEAAAKAQKLLASFDQLKIDHICESMAKAALREAARLGMIAAQETGFGIPEDKREKNRFAAEDVWNYFRSLKTVGVVSESKDVIEIASPRGVIAGIIPSTNPTSTAIFKALIAIKSRNAIVLSPHPSAIKCINETSKILLDAAVKAGLPQDAISCMTASTIEGTEALMKHKQTAVILATGGMGLVRAAYSSGKPAFGVGPGNVPVFIERSANLKKAVADILTGKCFDNGTICASEQAVVVDAPIAKAARAEFESQGAYFLNQAQIEQLSKVVATPQRTLNPKIVGKSAEHIAEMAGITLPTGTRCMIAEIGGVGRDHPLSMEKLSPILAFYVEDGLERGAARCYEVLSYGGMGHTAGIHTQSRDIARAYGIQMPASRIVVNSPTTHGAIGFSTALPPSMTLGCGSWGGNVTSDNISPLHLMDIKRVAFETKRVSSATENQLLSKEEPVQIGSINLQASQIGQVENRTISRESIATIVDQFLSKHVEKQRVESSSPLVATPEIRESVETKEPDQSRTSASSSIPATASTTSNGHKPEPFVCEDDVRRALQKGQKIYINARTIITPSARDLGESAEVFAKV
jgi:acetaldehyde dehydrogenase (acetylating)